MNNRYLKLELLLISTWFLGVMAVNFTLPLLPMIATQLHASATWVKYTISIFLFGKAAGMLLYGPLSEQYGRRLFVLIGLIIFAAGNLLAAIAPNITVLLCARLIQGLGTSATVLMGRVMINDIYKNNKAASVFGHIFLIAAIIIAFLPLLASFIAIHFHWRVSFIIMMSYSMIIFILCFFFLDETQQNNETITKIQHIIAHYRIIMMNPVFLGYVLCSIFMIAGESAFNTASSFLLIKTFGVTTKTFGALMTCLAVGHLIGTLFCAKLVKQHSLVNMMGVGVIILAVSACLMAACVNFGYVNVVVIIIPMIIFYIGTGFVMTITAVGVVTPFPKLIGTSSATSLLLFFSCSALSSAVMSILSTKTAGPITLLIAIYGVSAFLAWYFLIANKQHRFKNNMITEAI